MLHPTLLLGSLLLLLKAVCEAPRMHRKWWFRRQGGVHEGVLQVSWCL